MTEETRAAEWRVVQGSEHIYANRGPQHLVDVEIADYLNVLEADREELARVKDQVRRWLRRLPT